MPTQTRLPTETFTPKPTSSSTASSTPAASPTSSRTPTVTSIPTLPPDEGRALILDLLQHNAGCELPCWWGIIPGETDWIEAKNFLLQFDNDIDRRPPYADVLIPPETGFYGDLNQIGIRLMVQEDQVKTLEISGFAASLYTIPSLLKTYGKPEQIYIKTFKRYDDVIPFTLLLFYPELGITATYSDGIEKEFGSTVIRGCLQYSPVLYLWAPESKITLKDFGDLFDYWLDDYEPHLPLSEATEMDVTTFYETYQDYEGTICVETPDSIWPDPYSP